MILPLTRVSETFDASRHWFHLTRSISASWRHTASLNVPFVTMWLASVHLSPHCVTAFLFTARNEWWATCWTNQGCGEVRTTRSVYLSGAVTPTFARSALQFCFFASHSLYACAPLIP